MTPEQLMMLFQVEFGSLSHEWEQVSGHINEQSFVLVRIAGIKKGHLRRVHSMIEDVLAEEFGEGERE